MLVNLFHACLSDMQFRRRDDVTQNYLPESVVECVDLSEFCRRGYTAPYHGAVQRMVPCRSLLRPIDAAILKRYADSHFYGGLLPGCCNLHCTNTAYDTHVQQVKKVQVESSWNQPFIATWG